jgi:hypothetical protein
LPREATGGDIGAVRLDGMGVNIPYV